MNHTKLTRFRRFGMYMRRQNVFSFIAILFGITFVLTLLITLPVELGLIPDIEFKPSPMDQELTIFLLLDVLITAPLLETLLFQLLPMWIMWKFQTFRKNRWLIVLIPGVIFGAMHYYSVMYIVVTMIMGMLMMWGYIVRYKKSAYWTIALFHFCWNAFATIYNEYIEPYLLE